MKNKSVDNLANTTVQGNISVVIMHEFCLSDSGCYRASVDEFDSSVIGSRLGLRVTNVANSRGVVALTLGLMILVDYSVAYPWCFCCERQTDGRTKTETHRHRETDRQMDEYRQRQYRQKHREGNT